MMSVLTQLMLVSSAASMGIGALRAMPRPVAQSFCARSRTLLGVQIDSSPKAAAAEASEVPPLDEHPGRSVALLVEPTPFTHVSGYSNRFKEMLRFLKAGGDDAEVITPDDSPERPSNFLGMPITYVPGFRLIFYKQVRGAFFFSLCASLRPNSPASTSLSL